MSITPAPEGLRLDVLFNDVGPRENVVKLTYRVVAIAVVQWRDEPPYDRSIEAVYIEDGSLRTTSMEFGGFTSQSIYDPSLGEENEIRQLTGRDIDGQPHWYLQVSRPAPESGPDVALTKPERGA
jgi:hypothetical protein